MDGFEDNNKGIIVLAATNIPDIIDKAIMRPGRFDRKIDVSLPDLKGREQILKVHAESKVMSQDIDLKEVAKMCIGMSGADLANVLNEAAIHTARVDKKEVTMIEIKEAINKIKIGLE